MRDRKSLSLVFHPRTDNYERNIGDYILLNKNFQMTVIPKSICISSIFITNVQILLVTKMFTLNVVKYIAQVFISSHGYRQSLYKKKKTCGGPFTVGLCEQRSGLYEGHNLQLEQPTPAPTFISPAPGVATSKAGLTCPGSITELIFLLLYPLNGILIRLIESRFREGEAVCQSWLKNTEIKN